MTNQSRSEWISVEDRLPEKLDHVLTYRDHHATVDALHWIDEDGAWFSYCFTEGFDNEVTHWMPLPAPPEESDDESIPF